MKNQGEIGIALQLFDCLNPDERRLILDLIKELSSNQESSGDSRDLSKRIT